MRIQRVATKQGHPVPSRVMSPMGPFPSDLYVREAVITDYAPQSDGGGDEIPDEGTAQNNYQPYRWFRCRECGVVVREDEVPDHLCEGVTGG